MTTEESQPHPQPDPEVAKTHARAELRQAVWKADQFMGADDIRAYVDAVLMEIASDRP